MGVNRRLTIMLFLYALMIAGLVWIRPKEIDWRRSYDIQEETPFASKLVFEYLKQTHSGKLNVLRDSWADSSDTLPQNGNLVIIGEGAHPDEIEEEKLMEWVYQGGTLFWADRHFPLSIQDSFHFSYQQYITSVLGDSLDPFDHYEKLSWTGSDEILPVRFFVGYQLDACVPDTSFQGSVLSRSDEGHAVMLQITYGKGKLLIHSVPLVFTNFHFAERPTATYALQAFSYLSKGPVLWDQYRIGTPDPTTNRSPLRVIGRYPALKTAWYLSLIFGLMYLFWMGKRRQAIVPELAVKENKSLEFAEQLGDLYYKQSDARSILMKRIRGLQVYCREHYQIHLQEFSEEEKRQLAEKMGIAPDDLKKLWEAIHFIRRNRLVDETNLMYYNKLFNRMMH